MNEKIKKVLPLLNKKANELKRLYRLGREDREDMLQAGLLRLAQVADQYDPARAKWITFATVVTVNAMRNWLARRFRRARFVRRVTMDESIAASTLDCPERAAIIAEARRILADYLDQAGIAHQPAGEALRLYYLEGYKKSEILEKVEITPSDLNKTIEKSALWMRREPKEEDLSP